MINTLITEPDHYYRQGLFFLISEFFRDEFKKSVIFNFDFTVANIAKADVIVIPLCRGEYLTCFPECQSRRRGIIVGLHDADTEPVSQLPTCINDLVFISRKSSITEVRRKLKAAWRRFQSHEQKETRYFCHDCAHISLSSQQAIIMAGLYHGKSVTQIAGELTISPKTVFSHKYTFMQKFNLHSDYELLALLKKMAAKNTHPNVLREYRRV